LLKAKANSTIIPRYNFKNVPGEKFMRKGLIQTSIAALFCSAATAALTPSWAAAPTTATIISKEDVDAVLKSKLGDHTIRVMDMGQGYNMSVAVVSRGPTGGPPPARTPQQIADAAAARAKAEPCGLKAAPAGAKIIPSGSIAHDSTAETYIVIRGAGTLVTGGQIVDGRRSAPDSDVTTTLNGPSCSGNVIGNPVQTPMKVGDIAVIPAGIPHGWTNITTEVVYLSVRPDPKHVLPAAGYVYPALKKK
jgi:mannose-6-phosphate isomerase-like protein (cupin superfamily)